MIILYGIKNCDTVKKARKWLEEHTIAYTFYDLRQQRLETKTLKLWVNKLGWENLLNKRGTSWRKLSPSEQQISNEKAAIELMLKIPTLIKRPILHSLDNLLIGFDAQEYQQVFTRK